ncbi:MAG: polysaccharide biosynthesis protein [Defluviitaleaceae bacterium]|nr:polysaccharide biosynthesis protein [Defluviitaleaceae bacterium]
MEENYENQDQNNRNSSFVAQAAILASAGLISRVIGFAYKLPMQAMIGDKGMGIYNQGHTIYNFLLILSSAGLPAAISKMVSTRLAFNQAKNAHQVFLVSLKFAICIGLMGSLFLFFGARLFSNMLNTPEVFLSIRALAPTVFIFAILSVFRGYFQGMNNSVPTALSQIIEQILNAITSILLVFLLFRVNISYAAAGGNAATGIGAFVGLFVLMFIYKKKRPQIHKNIKRNEAFATTESESSILSELIRTSFPIIAGTAIFSGASLIDNYMVMDRIALSGEFTHNEILAMYGQLTAKFMALTTLPVTIATSMGTAAIPGISAAVAKRDMKSVTSRINMAIRLAMVVCVPAAFGIGLFADEILILLFPTSPEGGHLLRIGFVSVIFLALNQISTGVLQGVGQVKIPAFAALLGCIGKIITNHILLPIPSINIMGAVIGTVVCYAIAAPVNVYFAYKLTGARPDFGGMLFKPIFGAIFMSAVCFVVYHALFLLLSSNAFALLISIGVGVCVYFVVMIVIGGLRRGDLVSLPMGIKVIEFLGQFGIIVKE